MSRSTPATQTLERASIPFTLHEYQYDPGAENIGLYAAKALGIMPGRLLKTLMVKVDDTIVCALVPSNRELNLKKLAAVANGKSASMMAVADAERITGYHVGGISPFGQKKKVPVYVEKTVLPFPSVVMNGGKRGLQIELAPRDAVKVLAAVSADLV